MRTRRVIMLALVLAIVGTLFITNPAKGEYIEWAISMARPDSGHFLSRVIRSEVAPMYLDEATTVRNYGLFSLFYTETAAGDGLVALGICKQYILVRGYGILKE